MPLDTLVVLGIQGSHIMLLLALSLIAEVRTFRMEGRDKAKQGDHKVRLQRKIRILSPSNLHNDGSFDRKTISYRFIPRISHRNVSVS